MLSLDSCSDQMTPFQLATWDNAYARSLGLVRARSSLSGASLSKGLRSCGRQCVAMRLFNTDNEPTCRSKCSGTSASRPRPSMALKSKYSRIRRQLRLENCWPQKKCSLSVNPPLSFSSFRRPKQTPDVLVVCSAAIPRFPTDSPLQDRLRSIQERSQKS
jgi:hypothetical protein